MNTVSVCLVMFMILVNGLPLNGAGPKPDVVNIGACLAFDSLVGKVAKIALEAAVEDVNSNPSILKGTKLNLTIQDTYVDGFLAIIQTLKFMDSDTVAIIGPQSSTTAHVVSNVANELQIPLLSFSATDPTLSSVQFPFFVRTSQNDLFQMAAIASIVEHYEWREVIAIYGDDANGRNGISALGDKLAERRCRISFKAPLRLEATRDEIASLLVQVVLTESRIIIVHTNVDLGLRIFSVANHLEMMQSGYVWISTLWLTHVLDTSSPLSPDAIDDIQGVLTFRMHTPDSDLKREFTSRWHNLTLQNSKTSVGTHLVGLSTPALYAYDTVWLLARAIDDLINQGGNISFSKDPKLSQLPNGSLDGLQIFNEGKLLLRNILKVDMIGLTGRVKFTSDRNLIHPAYQVINVIGTGYRRIGYWSNHSGLSVVPPEMLFKKQTNFSSSNQSLYSVVWPGQTFEKPRGWVFPSNGRHLRIGVPNLLNYHEIISVGRDGMITGYCIDVFTAALNLLPYAVPYKLIPFGDGRTIPANTDLVRLITAGVYDAAVGDIAITTTRTKMVDFTQPYAESGLVVVASVWKLNSNALAFLRPFSINMWVVTAISFVVVGAVIWILEHRLNDEFRGPPRRQVVTMLWFSFSTLFFAQRENIVSTLGRIVVIIWLFVVLIITSSYTASLTSILTVQKLSSPIKGIETLIQSNEPIGYPQGSWARNYLIEDLGIHKSRLIPLSSPEEYTKALKNGPRKGGVAAIIDERPYTELFLSTRCEFSIVGHEFTKNGWGFAFPRDSELAVDMSTAILKLSENGDLQRIHDKWLLKSACTLQGAKLEVDRLQLKSFWGLFVICGIACLLALFIYFVQTVRQFSRHQPEQDLTSSTTSSARIQTFLSFVDLKEEDVSRHRSKRRRHLDKALSNATTEDGSFRSYKSNRRDIEYVSNTSFT